MAQAVALQPLSLNAECEEVTLCGVVSSLQCAHTVLSVQLLLS
jgi:hypothetical protein